MSFLDMIRMSAGNLWRRKLRTALTVLGVLIGTASIVAMLSLAVGMKKQLMDEYSSFGSVTQVTVRSGSEGGDSGHLDLSTMLTDSNMEMLNNMLGTQYKTFEEAKKGIAKNQGGLVEEMSTTLGGLLSTISGKVKNSLKGVTKVFADMLSGSMSGIIGFIDSISPKMVEFAEKVKVGFEAFAQSEQASQYMQIFKTVGETVFNAIKAVIDAVKPTVQSIFTFIGQHSNEISTISAVLLQ